MKENNITIAKELCTKHLLVPFESYAKKLPDGSCTAYPDPATANDPIKKGKPYTIGYGSTYDEFGNPIQMGDVWSHERALMVKQITLNKFVNTLIQLSPHIALESPYKIAAVLSWIYNCGARNYQISTFRKKVNECDWESAAKECMKWNKANGRVLRGLTRRRKAEADFLLRDTI